jgi:hypothetical protein
LTDEELEKVAGGNVVKTALDSVLLYAYGLVDDYHGEFHTTFNWKSDSAIVDDGWRKAGITCVTNPLDTNQYFINGKELSAVPLLDLTDNKYTLKIEKRGTKK